MYTRRMVDPGCPRHNVVIHPFMQACNHLRESLIRQKVRGAEDISAGRRRARSPELVYETACRTRSGESADNLGRCARAAR